MIDIKDGHLVVLPEPHLNDPRRKKSKVKVNFSSVITRTYTRG